MLNPHTHPVGVGGDVVDSIRDALAKLLVDGVWAKNCGGKDKGRVAKPKPLRIIPAIASPGVISSCSSGIRRVSIISMRPKSLITAAINPK
jgi:hypothetical protein